MIKNFISFIIILVLALSICSAQSIKISPGKSFLTINSEKNCTIIYVLPDVNTSIETRWSLNFSNNIIDYNLKEKDVGIKVNWTKDDYGKYRFCFQGTKNGIFYGAIMFLPKDSLVRMGSWIEIKIENQNILDRILITGNSIGFHKKTNFWLITIFILLLFIFWLVSKRALVGFRAIKEEHP